MKEIIPAVLPESFEALKSGLATVAGFAKTVHVDICDGEFTSEPSWPYSDNTGFQEIIRQDEGMPYWRELDFEIHLMIKNPEKTAEDWLLSGASRVIFHAEAVGDWERTEKTVKGRAELGIALNLETDVAGHESEIKGADFVHLMSIREVGYQGEELDEAIYSKIEKIKKSYPDKLLSVDGGVNRENARRLIAAGADRLTVGSAIMNADNPKMVFKELKKLF